MEALGESGVFGFLRDSVYVCRLESIISCLVTGETHWVSLRMILTDNVLKLAVAVKYSLTAQQAALDIRMD